MAQSRYDFAVIVALNEEAEYFRQLIACGDPIPTPTSNQAVWPIVDTTWDAYGHGVLMASAAMGVEPARNSTQIAISELNVRLIINIGIAGRVADWLNIGDVVVAREVWDFTVGGKVGGEHGNPEFQHAPASRPVTRFC